MHTRTAALSFVATALALSLITAPAFAGNKVKPEKITCEEFLSIDENVQPSVVYWLQGKSGDIDAIDVEEHQRPVAYVVTECYKEKTASVWDKVKDYFKTDTKSAPAGKN